MNLVIYTNILTPYRKYFYDLLNKECKKNGDTFHVLVMAPTEPNRTWQYDDLKGEYTILLNNKMFCKGETYVHYNNNLVETLKIIKPDVVVCAGSYLCPGVWTVAKKKNKLNYKCLYWSESHLKEVKSNNSIKIFIREILRKISYKLFDGFWYAGKLSREFCEKYATPKAKYLFLPNLIDEEKYSKSFSQAEKDELRNKMNIPLDKTVFICPARLSPVKGIIEFLEIMRFSENKKNAVILIAGTGELKNEIEAKAKAYEIEVHLLGQKSQEEMINLYGISDAFLLPSLSDPNPLTCIEALWANLPLLISEHCGNFSEVVHQGQNGYVFNYSEKISATNYIDSIICADRTWFEKAGTHSREIAKQTYNSSVVTKRILKETKNIC